MTFDAMRTLIGRELGDAVGEYLRPWCVRDPMALDALPRSVVSGVFNDDGSMVLTFRSEADEGRFTVEFAPPFTGELPPREFPLPKSYELVIRMHNGVLIRGPELGRSVALAPFVQGKIATSCAHQFSRGFEPFLEDQYSAMVFGYATAKPGAEADIFLWTPNEELDLDDPWTAEAGELVVRQIRKAIYDD